MWMFKEIGSIEDLLAATPSSETEAFSCMVDPNGRRSELMG